MHVQREELKCPFLALVGPNGGGKSTIARHLVEVLRSEGREVVLTREPGGSPGAEEIRRLILEGDADRWSATTEVLLFMAARRDHLERTIWPALERGIIVVSDRYLDDTRVFQTVTNPAMAEMIEGIVRACGIPEAHHTFLIDVPAEVSKQRMNLRAGIAEADRFEIMGDDFDEKVRQRYLAVAKANLHRVTIIDGARAFDEVLAEVVALVHTELTS